MKARSFTTDRHIPVSHLGSSAHLKRPKDDVHYPLRGEDIPPHHSCVLGRLKD